MKKYILSIFLLIIILTMSSCIQEGTSSLSTNTIYTTKDSVATVIEDTSTNKEYDYKIKTASNVDSRLLYKNMTLKVFDLDIPIYNCKTNFSHTWNAEAPQRMNNAVAIVELEGTARFSLTATFNVELSCTIRPLSEEIVPEVIDDRNIEFEISKAGQYTIEFSNDRTLHLFVIEFEKYDSYKDMDNVMYFSPGVHNKTNDKRINSNNRINLNSNTVVFLDEGAIVEARFEATNKSNIIIVGYGIVSGANFDRNANTGTATVPYDFQYCNNIKFFGISTLDPAGWCYNLFFSNNIEIDDIKIISSRSNGDGISLQSCQNVHCSNSFIRSWDDSLVVKNYVSWNNGSEGTTRNIYFDNCLLWTDLAQSMEIGYETIGEIMDNINFTNITVLHNYHKAPISIHNGNNANITNVHYKDIVIEDASMGKGDGKNILIEIVSEFSSTWSTNHKVTAVGSIDNVIIENVTVLFSKNPQVSIRGSYDGRSGYESYHYVTNVVIRNIYISGVKLDENYPNLEMKYSNNITFE